MSDKLKAIGFWIEIEDSTYPHPEKFVGNYSDPELKLKIINYLESGIECVAWRGLSYCRFYCGVGDQKMGYRDLTDGVWVWPEGLSHYIAYHDVILPPAFIDSASDNEWKIGEVKHDYNPRTDYDYKFWLTYCKNNT